MVPMCADTNTAVFSVQEILSSLDEVINNKYGKKVLLYLLSPRDPAHLLPEIIKVLEKGDGNTHRYLGSGFKKRV